MESSDPEMHPTYRIAAVPKSPRTDLIDTTDERIWHVLRNPLEFRNDGFGFRGVETVKRVQGGCGGKGYGDSSVTVLKNGLIELTVPLTNHQFQWYSEKLRLKDKYWLFPFAVAEMPLSFLLLAQKIFYISGYHTDLIVQQDLLSVEGFYLIPGHPAAPGYAMFADETPSFPEEDIIGDKRQLSVLDSAWRKSHDFVLEVYQSFGISKEKIPRLTELDGYAFAFDYMKFSARYRYTESGIEVEIVGRPMSVIWTKEYPYPSDSDERNVIHKAIQDYKREVSEKGRHPSSADAE